MTEPAARAACSFCLKPSTEVNRLVAGPGVFICDSCVALCAQLVDDPPPNPAPQLAAWDHATSVDQVLEALPRIAAADAQAERHLTGWGRRGRELGATWARIGERLGVTGQTAWGRFLGGGERVRGGGAAGGAGGAGGGRRGGAGAGPAGLPTDPPGPGGHNPRFS